MGPLKRQLLDCGKRKDIAGHLNTLVLYGYTAETIVELGTGSGASTSAFAFTRPKSLNTYDLVLTDPAKRVVETSKASGVNIAFHRKSSLDVVIGEPIDLLFIDTRHDADLLARELRRHCGFVKGRIIMHDTHTFGIKGEKAEDGLLMAMGPFLRAYADEWELEKHYVHCNGLTVLKRIKPLGE